MLNAKLETKAEKQNKKKRPRLWAVSLLNAFFPRLAKKPTAFRPHYVLFVCLSLRVFFLL